MSATYERAKPTCPAVGPPLLAAAIASAPVHPPRATARRPAPRYAAPESAPPHSALRARPTCAPLAVKSATQSMKGMTAAK
eukprot:14596589-Alexandrium_andersonii.AAC.1